MTLKVIIVQSGKHAHAPWTDAIYQFCEADVKGWLSTVVHEKISFVTFRFPRMHGPPSPEFHQIVCALFLHQFFQQLLRRTAAAGNGRWTPGMMVGWWRSCMPWRAARVLAVWDVRRRGYHSAEEGKGYWLDAFIIFQHHLIKKQSTYWSGVDAENLQDHFTKHSFSRLIKQMVTFTPDMQRGRKTVLCANSLPLILAGQKKIRTLFTSIFTLLMSSL